VHLVNFTLLKKTLEKYKEKVVCPVHTDYENNNGNPLYPQLDAYVQENLSLREQVVAQQFFGPGLYSKRFPITLPHAQGTLMAIAMFGNN
jgi:hypothetical protein